MAKKLKQTGYKSFYISKSFAYICEREKYNQSQGIFRCFSEEERCREICQSCRDYYSVQK